MTFLKWSMILGLAGLAIPVIIHLLSRRRTPSVKWGATIFLLGSVMQRNRRILMEEILMLALRCLLLALLVLAMARPIAEAAGLPARLLALPALILAAAAVGAGAALWKRRAARRACFGAAAGLLALALALVSAGKRGQALRLAPAGRMDIAVIIDASASMTLAADGGRSNFQRAVDEAGLLARSLRRGDAVGVILAGPSPESPTPAPLADRRKLEAALKTLRPLPGSMNVFEALSAAAVMLGKGDSPSKQVVLLTDGQALGWDVRNEARWRFVNETFAALAGAAARDAPAPVRMICRLLPPPARFQNLALTETRISRQVIGCDRPVDIEVRIENTGAAEAGPAAVALTIDEEEPALSRTVSLLRPGQSQVVTFSHQFASSATNFPLHTVQARLEAEDDLAADNVDARVIPVRAALPVLIVDGNPSRRPLDSASAFLAAALNPFAARAAEPPARPATPPSAAAAPPQALFDLTVVDASDAAGVTDLARYAAVILANVPRLPAESADRLRRCVEAGGGLLIAPGHRALPEFYNAWKDGAGAPVAGALLRERRAPAGGEPPAHPDLSTFRHPALAALAVENQSDLGGALLRAYWRLEPPGAPPSSDLLDSGAPFLVARKLGAGAVLTTAASLDAASGNLPTRRAFVPLVHELVCALVADDASGALCRPPSSALEVRLPARAGGGGEAERGLRGEYFAGPQFDRLALTRVDPALDWNWGRGTPAPGKLPPDHFSVRWAGALTPPRAGSYTLSLAADDSARLWLDGKLLLEAPQRASAAVPLEGGRPYDLSVEYIEGGLNASISLQWEGPGQPLGPIPAGRFTARRPLAGRAAQAESARLIAPGGAEQSATLSGDAGGITAATRLPAPSGLYRLQLPPTLLSEFSHLLGRGGAVPIAVGSAADEGRLALLSPEDFTRIARFVDWQRPASAEQWIAVLYGREVAGRELWRLLALGALALILGEVALANRIAARRRTGRTAAAAFPAAAAPAAGWARARPEKSTPPGEEPA